MAERSPNVIVLAGPNGAGKTTVAPLVLRETLGLAEFVNADTIAQGLAAFAPETVALEAGAILHGRLRAIAAQRRDFAFESTLASRSLAPWLSELIADGYRFHLVFLWLSSADAAVQRVADRVRLSGHGVPADTVRRRYERGLRNFFTLYRPLAAQWRFYDNTEPGGPRLIAAGKAPAVIRVFDPATWNRIEQEFGHGR